MTSEDNLNEVKAFIKTHFQKSEWKTCKLNITQLAELISYANNGVVIKAFELEALLRDMGFRHHHASGRYMLRLSDRLMEFARERMCLF